MLSGSWNRERQRTSGRIGWLNYVKLCSLLAWRWWWYDTEVARHLHWTKCLSLFGAFLMSHSFYPLPSARFLTELTSFPVLSAIDKREARAGSFTLRDAISSSCSSYFCSKRVSLLVDSINFHLEMNLFVQDSSDDLPQQETSTRTEDTLSPIEKLPRELVLKIVGYAPESVFSLKLVSNKQICEFLIPKKSISKIIQFQTSRLLRSRVIQFVLEKDTMGLVTSLEIDRSVSKVFVSSPIQCSNCNEHDKICKLFRLTKQERWSKYLFVASSSSQTSSKFDSNIDCCICA